MTRMKLLAGAAGLAIAAGGVAAEAAAALTDRARALYEARYTPAVATRTLLDVYRSLAPSAG